MKLGCCVNMISQTSSKVGEENIAILKEFGYDYVELPLAQTMDLSDEDFSRMIELLHNNKVPAEACNNFFPGSLRMTGENAGHAAVLEYARRAAKRAAQLGVKVIVLGSSGAKNIPEGFPYGKAKEQFISLLKGIQEIVAPFNITVALEPLNKKESNLIVNATEGLKIMNEADCANIRLLIDYYHMRMEDEGLEVIARAGSDLRHVHIAAKKGRLYPREGDGEDYGSFFAALKSAGYDARVSVEGTAKDIRRDAEAAARVLRKFM